MANFNDYSLRYFTCDGTYIGDFDVIVSLEFGRQKNETGIATLVLPSVYDMEIFNKDYVLEIWRTNEESNRKELVGNTCWFLRKIELCLQEAQQEQITLTFYDTLHLLTRRFVAWYEVDRGFNDGQFPGNYPSAIEERADVVLDLIFYHNFREEGINTLTLDIAPDDGDPMTNEFRAINLHQLVDAPRTGWNIEQDNFAHFARDTGVTPRTYSFAYETCLEAMNNVVDAAEATENRELWFDILYTPSSDSDDLNPTFGTLTFWVWWDYPGADHTWPSSAEPLLFGPEYQNILNPCLVLDWENEATQIIATSGSADNSVVGLENLANGVTIPSSASYAQREVLDECPFYPIEGYLSDNRSQYEDNTTPDSTPSALDSISSQAYAELRKRSAVHTLTGELAQTKGAHLFVDYAYGDLITVDWKKLTFDATISKFMITVDNNGESITIPFEGSVRQRFMQ